MASIQSHSALSLLMVEDDKTALDITLRMVTLKFPDCTIYTAVNGKEGLQLFKEHSPDVVITDINMPEMNGIEMAREIRSINDNATYIVLTAYSGRNYLEQFTEIGYCAYLMKPVDFGKLFTMIEKCGAQSKMQRGL